MRWIWADKKNRTNKIDHHISFETAKLVFNDPLAMTRHDPHPDADRWQTVGVIGSVAVFVVHTWPETAADSGEEVGRIIRTCLRSRLSGCKSRFPAFFLLTYDKYAARKKAGNHDFRRNIRDRKKVLRARKATAHERRAYEEGEF